MGKSEDGGDVAIVRTDALGDFILWLDAGRALAQHYQGQGRAVTLVANSAWADFAAELGIFDAIVPVDRRRFDTDLPYHLGVVRTLQRKRFAVSVQPTYSRDLFGDTLIRLTQAPERIGSAGNDANLPGWQKRVTDGWYTKLVAADPSPCMEMRRNADVVRQLADPGYLARVSDLRQLGAAAMDPLLLQALPSDQAFYVLFPGASWQGRQWPAGAFRELAKRIYREKGWFGVICGGPGEISLADDVRASATVPLINWAGRTSVSQLAVVIAHARLLVTNETAAVHIGASVGTPTVCLLGGGHYGRFMPYEVEQADERPLPQAVLHAMPCFGCDWRCIYPVPPSGPVPCVGGISVERAWASAQNLIRELSEVSDTTSLYQQGSPCVGGVTV